MIGRDVEAQKLFCRGIAWFQSDQIYYNETKGVSVSRAIAKIRVFLHSNYLLSLGFSTGKEKLLSVPPTGFSIFEAVEYVLQKFCNSYFALRNISLLG
jgi:hypothetical protein